MLNDHLWLNELDAHRHECQGLQETEDSQIPLDVEDIECVFREMVRTHDTESEGNSIVSLLCEICDEMCPSDKLTEHHEQCIQDREGVQGSGSASENGGIYLISCSREPIRIF